MPSDPSDPRERKEVVYFRADPKDVMIASLKKKVDEKDRDIINLYKKMEERPPPRPLLDPLCVARLADCAHPISAAWSATLRRAPPSFAASPPRRWTSPAISGTGSSHYPATTGASSPTCSPSSPPPTASSSKTLPPASWPRSRSPRPAPSTAFRSRSRTSILKPPAARTPPRHPPRQLCAPHGSAVAVVTINRPGALNSLTRPMIVALAGAFRRLDADETMAAVVLAGRGRAFCSGVDLTAAEDVFKGDIKDPAADPVAAMVACRKPIVGAIAGFTVTAGFEIVLANPCAAEDVASRRPQLPEAASFLADPCARGRPPPCRPLRPRPPASLPTLAPLRPSRRGHPLRGRPLLADLCTAEASRSEAARSEAARSEAAFFLILLLSCFTPSAHQVFDLSPQRAALLFRQQPLHLAHRQRILDPP
ncbi:uncharacterized protein LOC109719728 [Ananas comosus]|uniref:Uncharacterized protein LOC109719728 n=1 Tax=Ananas comosus TaxID=4615 RepID=A0A6P5G148_ANACO|nr:uncharacterized protein LOC109719728 [Ananas comosus]